MVNIYIYLFSIIILYRYIQYFKKTKNEGSILSFAYFIPSKIILSILCSILYIVFFISFYKLELYNIGYSHIDLLIIFAWILLTFLPDKIYKNGIKTSFFFVDWENISDIRKIKNNVFEISIKSKTMKKKVLYVFDRKFNINLIKK